MPDEVRALAARTDGELVVGGAVLGGRFLELGLVDEMRIYVHPVVVGAGRRLFTDGTPFLSLELRESKVFGNGVVLLHYAR